ncbi:hypothetical protein BGX26_009490, partial [Mortierella sp. AD094]
MQAALQDQSQQPAITSQDQASITNAIQALIAQNLEFAQLQQNASTNTHRILERLSQRSASQSPRHQIPLPLTTKYKGDDDDFTFSEFKAKLLSTFSRFPDALRSDHDRIQYALQSMEGTPFKYFAPYVNGDVADEDGFLLNYDLFMQTLEDLYDDQNDLDEV